MSSETDKLKPCPFCGGVANLVDATRVLGVWRVVHRCDAIGPISVENSERESAIAAWNRRTPSEALEASTQEAKAHWLEEALKLALQKTAQLPHDSDFTRGYTEGRLAVAAGIRSLKGSQPR